MQGPEAPKPGRGTVPRGCERSVPPAQLRAAWGSRAERRPRPQHSSNSAHLRASALPSLALPEGRGAKPLTETGSRPGSSQCAHPRVCGLTAVWGEGRQLLTLPADVDPRRPSLPWETSLASVLGHKLPHLDSARQSPPPPGNGAVSEGTKGRSCTQEGQTPAALPGTDEPLLPQCPLAPRGVGIVSDGGTRSSSCSGHLSLGRNLLRLSSPSSLWRDDATPRCWCYSQSYSFTRLAANFYMSPSGRLWSLALMSASKEPSSALSLHSPIQFTCRPPVTIVFHVKSSQKEKA